jgi:hypothetical protein
VLRSHLRGASADAVPPALRADLAPLLPEFGANASYDDRFRLFAAVVELLRRVAAKGPVAVFLDDLHAADLPSVLLLRFTAMEIQREPILLVASYRDDELSPALAATLADLVREPWVRRVELSGLDAEATGKLLELTTGAAPRPALVAKVQARTDGNPLFSVEIGRLLVGGAATAGLEALPIPTGITEAIQRRLELRSDRCRQVLAVASILGREFAIDSLAAAARLGEDELLDVLEEAEEARLVGAVPGQIGHLRFSHMMVRDALYEALPASRRMRLHRRIADTLEALYASDPEPHLSEIASHFLLAGGGAAAKATEYAIRAAEQASRQQAHEEAAVHYAKALEVLTTTGAADGGRISELLLARGEALRRSGDEREAKRAVGEAADRAEQAGRADVLAHAAVAFGGRFSWTRASADPAFAPLLARALSAVGEEPSPMRVLLLARLTAAHRDEPRRARIQGYAEEALRLARELGDPPTLAIAFEAWFTVAEAPDRVRDALDACPEIVALSDRVGDAEHAYTVHDFVFNLRWKVADRAGIDTEFERLRHLAAELRQPPHQWAFGTAQTLVALLDGRLQDAECLIEETLALGRAAVSWNAEVTHRIALLALRRHQGRLAELDDIMSRSVQEYPALMRFSCALAHFHAELGRPDKARALVDELLAHDLSHEHVDAEWLFSMWCSPTQRPWPDPTPRRPSMTRCCHSSGCTRRRRLRRRSAPSPAPSAYWRARPNARTTPYATSSPRSRRSAGCARGPGSLTPSTASVPLLKRGAPGDADRGGAVLAEARRAYATLGMYSWARRCLTDAGTSPPI